MATMLLLLLVNCGPSPGAWDATGADARLKTAARTALSSAIPPAPVPDAPRVPLPMKPSLPDAPPLPDARLVREVPPVPDAPSVPLPLEPPAPVPTGPDPWPQPESPPPSQRTVTETGWSPFATVGGVVLRHPSSRVERVGFHEANHDGARQLEVLATAVDPITMETRQRGTGSRSAADVVVDPQVEIRAPVTGTVLRAGSYVLYCDYRDDFAVIEPDDHPGWEVKVLHIDGVRVRQGARVTAGETVLAGGPTVLPFSSQVDEHTAEPSWPHVHLEVVDPSIPNRPSADSRC